MQADSADSIAADCRVVSQDRLRRVLSPMYIGVRTLLVIIIIILLIAFCSDQQHALGGRLTHPGEVVRTGGHQSAPVMAGRRHTSLESPLLPSFSGGLPSAIQNLASRAARWSAGHRKTAISGWLAFVIVSVFIAGAVGQQTIADEDYGNGESRPLTRRSPPPTSATLPRSRSWFRARLREDRRSSLHRRRGRHRFTARSDQGRRQGRVPARQGQRGQLSEDGRSALVTFEIPGDDEVTEERVDGALAATAAAQKANPQVFVGQFGDASADKAISKAFEEDFQKAEVLSLPITLIILIVAFGSLVAAGVPLLLGVTAVAATIGLLAPISQLFPMDESVGSVVLLVGLAVGVDYSMFYLRRKMEERDAGRRPRTRSSSRRRPRPGRAHLRPDRDDRDGRHVLRRQHRVPVVRDRHDPGRRHRGARVAHRAPRGPLQARRQGREGPRADHRAHAPPQSRRVPRMGLDPRPRAAPPVASLVVAGILVALSIPALGMHTANPGVGLPRDLEVMKVYDRIQAAFPAGRSRRSSRSRPTT